MMTPQVVRRFRTTKSFDKEYDTLPQKIKKKTKKAFSNLKDNFSHPSVRARIHNKEKKIWEGRVDREYRFTFTLVGDILQLRHIGNHDIYRNP